MSKAETFVNGALLGPSGMWCGKGLVLAAALVASVAAVYILVPCLKPSAKRLLASVSNAVAVGTMRVKPSLWLCLESLQVRPCIVLLYYIPRGIPSAVLACWVLGF